MKFIVLAIAIGIVIGVGIIGALLLLEEQASWPLDRELAERRRR